MIITQKKPIEEVMAMVGDAKTVVIVLTQIAQILSRFNFREWWEIKRYGLWGTR